MASALRHTVSPVIAKGKESPGLCAFVFLLALVLVAFHSLHERDPPL